VRSLEARGKLPANESVFGSLKGQDRIVGVGSPWVSSPGDLRVFREKNVRSFLEEFFFLSPPSVLKPLGNKQRVVPKSPQDANFLEF